MPLNVSRFCQKSFAAARALIMLSIGLHGSVGAAAEADAPRTAELGPIKSEASRETAKVEQNVDELLALYKCQDAILALHYAYSRSQAPRLHLYYGRAFRQCQDRYGMLESYRKVLREPQLFSAAECEEARRAIASPPPPSPRLDFEVPRVDPRADEAGAAKLIAAGGTLLGFGIAGSIGGIGQIIAGSVGKHSSEVWPGAMGFITLAPITILLTIPGAVMLKQGFNWRNRLARRVTPTVSLIPTGPMRSASAALTITF